MATINPFLEDAVENPLESVAEIITSKSSESVELSLDIIAEELLKHKYTLTALELYTEIQERGKDLPRLKNYFSNPSNFEQQINNKDGSGSIALYRTGSCSTFDSLDMARYSDEGGGQVDEKVAVLEFELRKAKDTIKSLRANLTQTAEQESSFLQENSNFNNETESSTQDTNYSSGDIKPLEMRAINHLVNEYLLNHGYKLSSITFADENEDQDFEDWHDVGLNTPKPPEILTLYRDYSNHAKPNLLTSDACTSTDDLSFSHNVAVEETEKITSETQSTDLLAEELEAEIAVLKENNKQLQDKIDSLLQKETQPQPNHSPASPENVTHTYAEAATQHTEEVVIHDCHQQDQSSDSSSNQPDSSRMSLALWKALLMETQSTLQESWLTNEVVNVSQSADELVGLLSRCLPHVVPTVLLAKRDQLVPLLLSAAALHHDLQVRNELLHILFNLIKKPDDAQRQTILHGCTAYARHVGCHRSEEELLPQFWEQLGHKYSERRQLVAEACGAIAPYLRSEMRGSLLVSILQQMQQEEKIDSVRSSVAKSLALIFAFLDDDDKYKQGFSMLQSFLSDKCASVRETAYRSLLPSFAVWSLHCNSLHSHLLDSLLKRLEAAVEEQNEDSCLMQCAPMTYLMPYLFAAVLREIEVADLPDDPNVSESRFPHFKRDLENPSIIIGDGTLFARLVSYFDEVVASAKIDGSLETLLWVTHQFIPNILKILKFLKPTLDEAVLCVTEMMQMFSSLFGSEFIKEKISPQLVSLLEASVNNLSTSLVPVYVVAILPNIQDSKIGLNEFLFTSIVRLAQADLSVESIKVTLTFLCSNTKHHDTIVQVLWSAVMHESSAVRACAASLLVVMTTAHVSPKVLSSRILPALITLATDQDINVKKATLQSFCQLMVNPTVTMESVERVIAQMTETVSSNVVNFPEEQSQDGTLLGLHSVRSMLVSTISKIGATAHPKFRDEFILPHLVAIAASNNQVSDSSKRSTIALALLEAYSCLSCCFIATSLLQGTFLPALKCLNADMDALHPEQVSSVTSLISEAEQKLEQGSVTSDGSPRLNESSSTVRSGTGLGSTPLGHAMSVSADDAKKRIMHKWDQIKSRTPSNTNLFHWKK